MSESDAETIIASESSAGAHPGSQSSVLRGAKRPEFLRDELLAEIFAETVKTAPQAIAMTTMERKLSYGRVDHEATALARGLIRRGIGPGDVVGLWGARGPELLIGQIAIAKTGAAWLPFDADAPVERIETCLQDAQAKALLTSETFALKARGGISVAVVTESDLIDANDQTPVDARKNGTTPDHPAYMIYTSGSTGTPKGIVITGRNICHYLRSANANYGVTRADVVFQGASIAFDLSMEEIWIPYLVGAELFVATPEVMGEADKLPDLMDEIGVSVLDTVPTLLSLLPRDPGGLRLIILGGEACPPALAARWCKPGRKIFNSYGPTEATVVATMAEVHPDKPVSIGDPIANYTCYVADEANNLLPRGVEGELLIGGPGVARGYLKRETLTAEKFIANPFPSTGDDPILYRSGDAVVMEADGSLSFHGRIDDQVKIRGFRVELGEIEAKLSIQPGVKQAAVVLRNDDGMDQLVAFLVPEDGATLDPKILRSGLRATLPAYMTPARYETRENLPRLSSGKVDRKALKKEPLTAPATAEAQEDPQTETEALLLEAALKVLPPQTVPFEADFFTDLGGHSLLAARFVSIVRQTPRLAGVTLQDMYSGRTLRAIAALLDEKSATVGAPKDLSFTPPPLYRRFLCGLAQAICLPFLLALSTAQWLGIFVSYMLLTDTDASFGQEVASLLGVYLIVQVVTVILAIAVKWIVIGKFKPGRYPIWGVYYFRWWLVQRMLNLTHIKWFQGSPLMRIYLKALGVRVGQDANISELEIGAFDLVSIGEGTTIGQRAKLSNVTFVGDEMIVGPIEIGPDCYIGSSCVIEDHCVLEEGAEMRDLTALAPHTRVRAWEIFDGSPGVCVGSVDKESLRPFATVSAGKRSLQTFLYTLLLLAIPPVGLLPLFPAFWVFDRIDEALGLAAQSRMLYMEAIPIMAWPTAFVMVLVTVGFIACVRWIVLPRVREGNYSVFSWFYMRKWAVALATEVTLETLSSLYATIYMRTWYRLMGAKIGKDSEISTNLSGRYDLVEIGDKCFIADEVILGDEDIRRGWMRLEKLTTGSRVFVGNDGVVPPGAVIPDGALIGIKSKPPANDLMSPGDTWFGSPPIKLPVRQRFDGAGANWTYEPPKWKKIARGVFEAVHISLPTMLFITFGTWAIEWFGPAMLEGRYGEVFWMFVAASTLIAAAMTLVVVAVKWLTMGRYEPVTKPMWSWWAMRTEAVAVLYWGLAGKVMLDHLRCTPFLPWFMRLFGAKIGKGCVFDMTDITEFDCVEVGDFCNLNALCALQTHLYEDRVMKVGRVKLGSGVTVGAGSTVLYDSHVGDYARLGPLTIVMKGESIPANTEWAGSPAAPAKVVNAAA
ncbi:peptide synthetase [Rhodoblastus sphagnicola]|uniref:Peptide synthetase n=1 Tax=Rhodoblastus sphagnicola TaxID=333368 RepID=A0A2S6NAE4_9HYPH|nr:Pls/PosA family non-ribosomal peptide synthetase [Rhodoblastus sphagnicola]MBB4199555.1 non-ribosomal peptide synthetase-like protein [Rhodoblastus sphagnicola]PPQ31602.1 peptide synthetase [Rhodoblastus sphagnicola]